MAKKSWCTRFALVVITIVMISCVTLPAFAEGQEQQQFILIGDDGTYYSEWKSLLDEMVFGIEISDDCLNYYLNPIYVDCWDEDTSYMLYQVETFINSMTGYVYLAGYRYGGETLFYMDLDNVDEVFLLNATTTMSDLQYDPESSANFWTSWILFAACNGKAMHLYASNDEYEIFDVSARIAANLSDYAAGRNSFPNIRVIPYENLFIITDMNNIMLGLIEVSLVEKSYG